jgi:hypothetical protein
MKQYDKIWVPEKIEHKNGQMRFVDRDGETPVLRKENVIVLTIEELQGLWNAAQDRMHALQVGYPGDTKIFEAYLESKGIII